MPKALEGIDWDQIKVRYLTGTESLKQIADSLGVKDVVVRAHAARGKWKFHRDNGCNKIQTLCNEVTQKVGQRTKEAVESHLASMVLTGEEVRNKIANSLIEMDLPTPKRHDVAESHVRMLKNVDDIIRRAYGLAEPTSRVDITSGGLPMHEKALAILQSVTRLVEEGTVEPKRIDVAGLVSEMGRDAESKELPKDDPITG